MDYKEFAVMAAVSLVVVILGAVIYDFTLSDAVTRAKSKDSLEE